MPPVVIDNPILNSPFREPARHFRFDDDGITNEIAEAGAEPVENPADLELQGISEDAWAALYKVLGSGR